MSELARRSAEEAAWFELDQRRATAYAESGYWPDAKAMAQALVKIEAGRSLGLSPLMAMSEIHVINGDPEVGAGGLAALVKMSGRYDYRVIELTEERCVITFVDVRSGEVLGDSVFTMAHAEKAKLTARNPTYRTFPRNMLFARAMSNGVAWFCPDVVGGRVYVQGELRDEPSPPLLPAGPSDWEPEPDEEIEWPDVDENAAEPAPELADEPAEPEPSLPVDRNSTPRTKEQNDRIHAQIRELESMEAQAGLDPTNWRAFYRGAAGAMPDATLTRAQASLAIDALDRERMRLYELVRP